MVFHRVTLALGLLLSVAQVHAAGRFSSQAIAWAKANTPTFGLTLYFENQTNKPITVNTTHMSKDAKYHEKFVVSQGKPVIKTTQSTKSFIPEDRIEFNFQGSPEQSLPMLARTQRDDNTVYVYHVFAEDNGIMHAYSYNKYGDERITTLPAEQPAPKNSVLTDSMTNPKDIAKVLLSNRAKYGSGLIVFVNASSCRCDVRVHGEGTYLYGNPAISKRDHKAYQFAGNENPKFTITVMIEDPDGEDYIDRDITVSFTRFLYMEQMALIIGMTKNHEATFEAYDQFGIPEPIKVNNSAASTSPVHVKIKEHHPHEKSSTSGSYSKPSSTGSSYTAPASHGSGPYVESAKLPAVDPGTVTADQIITLSKKDDHQRNQIYRLFGLPYGFTRSDVAAKAGDIKKVYFKLSLKFHPDKAPDPSLTSKYDEAFKGVGEFYKTILVNGQPTTEHNPYFE
jgi:hypothetical protein